MATREWTQFDIEAAAEATAIHALRKMRPQGIKPKKSKRSYESSNSSQCKIDR